MADYNLSAHFGATDDISPALSQIIAGLQAVSAATATFQQATGQAGQASAQGFAAAGQAAQQMGQQAQAAGQATAGATGGIGQMGQAAAGASVQIGSLNVTLTQSHQAASQAQSMYLSLGAALNQLPGPLGNLASGFAMLHGRISETNAGLLAATTTIGVLSASLAGGLGQAIEAGMQFQRTFAEVQIVTQATAEQMKQLQDAAIQIGASTQYNAQQAAQGLYELGSAGFTASESIKALTPITTAAMLGNRSLGDTTKEVVAGLRQFGMSATDTTHLVDVMTTAVQGSVVHWNEIGGLWDNLRGRMGQLRIPLEDVVAAEMLMTNSGMSAAQASTAIGTAVDRLSKQTRETAQGLKELGLNVFDASGQFVGLLNIYQQLDARLPSMTVAQQAHAMAMLGGSRAAGAFLNILQQQQRVMKDGNEITLQGVDLFNYWAETLRNSDGATERAANIMRDTLDNQLKVLNGSIGEVAIRIGTQFLPALSAIVPQMTDTLNMFVKADPAIHAMTAGAGAAAVAFGTLTTVMGAWSAMMNTSFGPALIAARGALVAFIPQLLLVAAASAALALAWEQDWGNIREHTRDAADAIGGELRQIAQDVGTLTQYIGKIELPKLKLEVETGIGGTGLGQLFAELGDAKNLLAATGAGKLAGDAWNFGFATQIAQNPAIPTNWIRWGQEAIAQLHAIQPGIQAALHDAMSPQEVALEQSSQLDAMAYGAVSKIKQGADLESAAMSALWDQVWEADRQGIDKTGISTQENLDLVMARVKELMAKSGHDIGFTLAQNIAGSGNAVQDSINAMMAETGGDVTKALNAFIGQGNQIAATQLATTQAQHKVIQSSLAGSSAAYRVQIDIMEHMEGPLRALNQLYSDGHISADQYNAAMMGIVKSTRDEAKANDELEKSLKAVHAAMTPGQKIYEQQAQGVVAGISQGLSIDARARLADFQEGKTAQEQLKQMVEAAGAQGVTLTDLYYGTPKQNEERIALLAAALQGGGISRLAPAAKAAAVQYTAGVAEGIQTGTPAAVAAATASGAATSAALNKALKEGLTNGGEIAAQFSADLANGMDFSAAQERLQNALSLNPETYRAQGAAAGTATTEGVAAGIVQSTPGVNTAADTLATGIHLAIEGTLTPELFTALGGKLISQIGDGIAAGDAAIRGAVHTLLTTIFTPGGEDAGTGPTGNAIADQILSGIVNGLTNQTDKLVDGVRTAIMFAINPTTALVPMAALVNEIGSGIVDGIVEGIKAAIPGAASAAGDAIGGLIAGIKIKLGITSPSTVAAEQIGRPLAEGIGVGFSAAIGGVQGLVSAGVQGLMAGMSASMDVSLGAMVDDVSKKIDETAQFSPITMGDRQVQHNVSPGFSAITWDDAAKMLQYPELNYEDIDKSYPGLRRTFRNPKTLEKGYTIGPINYGYGADEGGGDDTPETYNPYDQPPGLFPDDVTIARFSPGFGGLGRATGGFDLQGALDSLAQSVGVLAEVAQQGAGRQFTPVVGPDLGTVRGQGLDYQGGIQGYQAPIPGTPATPGYVWDYNGGRIPAEEWARQVANRNQMDQINVPPAPEDYVAPTYAQNATLPPYEPPGTTPYAFGGQIPVIGPLKTGGYDITGQRSYTEGEMAAIVASLANIRTPSSYGRPFSGDTIPADVGGLEGFLQHYREQGVDVQPYTGPSGANFRTPIMTDTERAAAISSLADELLGQAGIPAAYSGNNIYQGAQNFPRPYIPNNPNPTDDEIRQYQQSMYYQSVQRETGDVPVGARFSGYVPYNQGRGPWIGAPQNNPYTATMQAMLSTFGDTLGRVIVQFDSFQSSLTSVTEGLGSAATSADTFVTGFQDASQIFPGEGGPGLSSGLGSMLFNQSLANGALLPGNLNPSDYYAPAGFGNGFSPTQPFPGANQLTTLLSQYRSNGSSVMPASLAQVGWMMGPGGQNAAMPASMMLQAGFGDVRGEPVTAGQQNLLDRYGITPGTVATQSFNDLVATLYLKSHPNAGRPVNAAGLSVDQFFDQLKTISGGGASSPTVQVGSGLATSLGFIPSSAGGAIGGVQQDPITSGDAIAKIQADTARNWAVAKDNAKRLADSSSLVGQSWSSIADLSKSVDSSMAHVAGAFSAYAIDLNAGMASSITGSFVKPTFGGPSGPNPVGGSFNNGGTAGGIAFSLTQQAGASIVAANGGVVPPDFQQQLVQMLQGNKQYTDVVGQTTETTSDLAQQQKDLTNRVFQLQSEANALGSAYAAGIGVMDQLNAAQAALAANVAAMAGSVGGGGGDVGDPLSQFRGQPMPTQPPPGAPAGHWVVGAYGQGWQWLPDSASGGTPPPTVTGGIATNATIGAPPSTGSTGGTPTPTPPAINPNAPVLVGRSATEDIYRMPNGTLKRVPRGTTPPGGITTPTVTSPTTTTPPAIVSSAGAAMPDLSADGGSTRPTVSGASTVAIGDVHVTINAAGGNVADPLVVAKVGKAVREEMRREGAFFARTRN